MYASPSGRDTNKSSKFPVELTIALERAIGVSAGSTAPANDVVCDPI